MKITAINAGPRARGNTAALLNCALDIAALEGHDVKLIQLSELTFKGCRSCFVCKLDKEPNRSQAACAVKDDLSEVLTEAKSSDMLLIGSPIYFGNYAADYYALLERLFFPGLVYSKGVAPIIEKPVPAGFIFTMNTTAPQNYVPMFEETILNYERFMGGDAEVLVVADTCQFPDYSKYVSDMFDAKHKSSRRITPFSEEYVRTEKFMRDLLKKQKKR